MLCSREGSFFIRLWLIVSVMCVCCASMQAVSLVREIEISHWGNIYVEETYELVGARVLRNALFMLCVCLCCGFTLYAAVFTSHVVCYLLLFNNNIMLMLCRPVPCVLAQCLSCVGQCCVSVSVVCRPVSCVCQCRVSPSSVVCCPLGLVLLLLNPTRY